MAMLVRLLTWSLTNTMSMLSCTPVNVRMHVQCVFVMNVNAQNTAQFAWQAPPLRHYGLHNDPASPQVISVSVSANARRTGNQARQQLGEQKRGGKGGDGVADEGWGRGRGSPTILKRRPRYVIAHPHHGDAMCSLDGLERNC